MAFALSATLAPKFRSVLRVVVGLMFMLHGAQKLLGFPDPAAKLRPHAPAILKIAGVIELVCGALIAAGLLTSIVALIASGEMAVAYFKQHAPNGLWPTLNGGELAVLYCFVFLYFAFAGPGPWSIDALIGRGRTRRV
jgi:putative oxidoreductase